MLQGWVRVWFGDGDRLFGYGLGTVYVLDKSMGMGWVSVGFRKNLRVRGGAG